MTNTPMTAEQFKQVRMNYKWSQKQMALKLHTTRRSIIRYEHGDYPVPVKVYALMKAKGYLGGL